MKPVKIRRDSKLYRFARACGGYDNGEDLCSFTRAVLKGVFSIVCVVTTVSSLWTVLSILAYHILVPLNVVYPMIIAIMSPLILVFLGFIVAMCFVKVRNKLDKRRYERVENRPPESSLLSGMYSSWKEKFCRKVEIVY